MYKYLLISENNTNNMTERCTQVKTVIYLRKMLSKIILRIKRFINILYKLAEPN